MQEEAERLERERRRVSQERRKEREQDRAREEMQLQQLNEVQNQLQITRQAKATNERDDRTKARIANMSKPRVSNNQARRHPTVQFENRGESFQTPVSTIRNRRKTPHPKDLK